MGSAGGMGGGSMAGGSATGTVVFVLLLVRLASVSLAFTADVASRRPVAIARAVIVTVAEEPAARSPSAQTTGPVPAQLPCDAEDDTKTSPIPSCSLRTTFVAGCGPLFVTTYVRVTVEPFVIGAAAVRACV